MEKETNLRALRHRHGVCLTELAGACGLSNQYLSRAEMGLFELRNLVEAVVLTLPVLYLCFALLPLGLTTRITVTLIIAIPLGGFGLMGVRDDSLTRWVGSWWRWRRNRRLMTYRGGKS